MSPYDSNTCQILTGKSSGLLRPNKGLTADCGRLRLREDLSSPCRSPFILWISEDRSRFAASHLAAPLPRRRHARRPQQRAQSASNEKARPGSHPRPGHQAHDRSTQQPTTEGRTLGRGNAMKGRIGPRCQHGHTTRPEQAASGPAPPQRARLALRARHRREPSRCRPWPLKAGRRRRVPTVSSSPTWHLQHSPQYATPPGGSRPLRPRRGPLPFPRVVWGVHSSRAQGAMAKAVIGPRRGPPPPVGGAMGLRLLALSLLSPTARTLAGPASSRPAAR